MACVGKFSNIVQIVKEMTEQIELDWNTYNWTPQITPPVGLFRIC